MHKQSIIKDRMQGTARDLNDLQTYTRETIDNMLLDTVHAGYRYSGLQTVQSAPTVITCGTGRLYALGKMYTALSETTLDMIDTLPVSTKKMVALIATGAEIETDNEPRSFIVDVESRTTEAQVVATRKHRLCTLSRVVGVEAAAPVLPSLTTGQTLVATIILNSSGVESITMNAAAKVASNDALEVRAVDLENWRVQAGERLNTLGTDVSSLAQRMRTGPSSMTVDQLVDDMSDVKYQLNFDAGASDYGMDPFLDGRNTDDLHAGYDAKIEEGVRFPDEAISEGIITLSNPSDPSLKVHASGLTLPKYTQKPRITVDGLYDKISLDQYAYQTIGFETRQMAVQRLRVGTTIRYCLNGDYYNAAGTKIYTKLRLRYDYATGVFTDTATGRTYRDPGEYRFTTADINYHAAAHTFIRLQEFWYDEELIFYQERVVVDHEVSGSVIAQTFLNTQIGWLTSLDLAFTDVGSTGDIDIILCETIEGKPNTNAAIATVTVAVEDLVEGTNFTTDGEWTRIPLKPTALEQGKYYAVVIMTGGDHYVGLAQGTKYASGTLFYSTDGVFFMGDLTKDLMFKANFAEFSYPRIEIELGTLSLSGGMVDVDLLCEALSPAGTSLTWEVRPDGQATWYKLSDVTVQPFATKPILCYFRAILLGTKDMMPGVNFPKSRYRLTRPDISFDHFTIPLEFVSTTQSIRVVALLDYYKEADHDFVITLNDITNAVDNIAAASVSDEVLGEYAGDLSAHKRIRRTFTWTATEITTATDEIVIKSAGDAASELDLYHVERLSWMAF